jgi:hypothetical protein
MQFSSYLLSPNILLSVLFSFAVDLFSFSIEDEISHPHRTTRLRTVLSATDDEYEKLDPQYGIRTSGWRKTGAHK